MRVTNIFSGLLIWSVFLVSGNPAFSGKLNIKVEFPDDSLTSTQRVAFTTAANRWGGLISGAREIPQPYILTIEASGKSIDGPRGVLGQAGPTHFWQGTHIPARGVMEFDTADLALMETEGSLVNVITHEMGHVLGLGTMWSHLIDESNPRDLLYKGEKGIRVYTAWRGSPEPLFVPVESGGGEGTRGGHWSEYVFANELMTGYLNEGINPLSTLTLAAYDDLGYTVRYDRADVYRLPTETEVRDSLRAPSALRVRKIVVPVAEKDLIPVAIPSGSAATDVLEVVLDRRSPSAATPRATSVQVSAQPHPSLI